MKKNLINSQPASYIGDIQAKTEWRGYKGGPWRFRSCAGRHGNRGIWTYSGRGPQKNAQLMENAFYNKENLNPDIHGASGTQNNNNNMISVPDGVDADMLMKVLGNPEMAALLTSLAKSMNLNDPPEVVHRSTKNMIKILDVGFII